MKGTSEIRNWCWPRDMNFSNYTNVAVLPNHFRVRLEQCVVCARVFRRREKLARSYYDCSDGARGCVFS